MFAGYVPIGNTLHVGLQTRVGDLPTLADAFPFFRVYSPTGLLPLAGSQAVARQTGPITGASNANPIVITAVGHTLTTGMRVSISGVLGNTAANTTAVVTVIDANTFSIPVAGNGAYVSGGTWSVTGFYDLPVQATALNGFVAGQTYTLLATYTISSVPYSQVLSFGVV